MKYYTYSGRKSQSRAKSKRKKIILNILIIVFVIALCVAFALILGNHLRKKLEAADISTEPVESIISKPETDSSDPADEIGFVKNDREAGSMSALYGYLDLEGCPDEASAQDFVYALKADGYTGISFNVRSGSGMYSYASAAASDISRVQPPESAASLNELKGAVYAASSIGMRSLAYIDMGDLFLTDEVSASRATIDRAVIRELSSIGFSEIVIDGVTRDSDFTVDFAKKLYGVMSQIRPECPGTDFGIVIDPSVLEDPEKTPALEIVFRFVDFFALDLSNKEVYTPEKIAGIREKHSGSFSAYSILSLIGGSDIDEIREGYASFSSADRPNAAFMTRKTDYEVLTDDNGNELYTSKLAKYSLVKEAAPDGEGTEND